MDAVLKFVYSSYPFAKSENEILSIIASGKIYFVNQIITDSLLIGKNRNDIEAILGESEWFGWDENLKANSEEKWNYNMGFVPGAFNNLQECLELQFKNNSVKSVRPYQLEKTFE